MIRELDNAGGIRDAGGIRATVHRVGTVDGAVAVVVDSVAAEGFRALTGGNDGTHRFTYAFGIRAIDETIPVVVHATLALFCRGGSTEGLGTAIRIHAIHG